jgi:PAS domain S-box-containing protein
MTEFSTHSFTDTLRSISVSSDGGAGVLKLDSLAQRIHRAVWQYGFAVLSVTMALAITNSLERYTTLRTPLFYIAIIISAWFGGIGPGLLVVALSTLLVGYYFAPGNQTPVLSLDNRPFILIFALSALLACWVSVQRRRAEEVLKGARDELEARVEERTSDLRRVTEGLQAEIAERKRGEEVLRERANLLDLTHDTVFVRDNNDVITFWNRGAEKLYGWTGDEAVGQVSHHLTQTTFPAPLEKITAELKSTGRWEGELIHTRRDGTRVVVASRWALQLDGQGKPVAVLETNNDITERKSAEEALHKAQAELAHVTRVATLGEMTASISHEVNQPLAAVVTNANACLRWLARQSPDLDEARTAVERIIRDGSRASEVIGRIRDLVKKSPPRQDWLSINDTILEVIALARSEMHMNRVSLQTQLADNLPAVRADRIQLQQVILNLLINGIEAMNRSNEGSRQLRISTERDGAKRVLIAVRDSGVGLNPEDLEHLFDPFYTTKRMEWGWGWRSAARSSRHTGAFFGLRPIRLAVQSFNSRCPMTARKNHDYPTLCKPIRKLVPHHE